MTTFLGDGNLSTTERGVEWLRDHHYGDLVSQVEHFYYSRHQPPTGGTLSGLPKAVSDAPLPAAGPTATAQPDSILPLASAPVPGEGVWQPYGDVTSGAPSMQVAYLRPDDIHGTVLAAVVRIDQTKAKFRLVPGTDQPGGAWPGSGQLSTSDASTLIAAFNSGFRIADANGGFALGTRGFASLRNGAASLVINSDQSVDIGAWSQDVGSQNKPVAVRQNLDLIVQNGTLAEGLDDNAGNRWGRTVGNRLYVWRSGIGVDAQHRIIYVASSGLTVKSLAQLLQHAGAVRAMELDINHAWVTFNSFHHGPGGQIHGSKLLDGMAKSADRYLTADSRDFVAVLARGSL